ncbi:MAG TPA: hypothetical protein VEH48_00440 [Candidatus Nitrosopolaris sp.]|nr:hypothetical protein [Candidatus Nitrosopolaris sp.]
MPRDDEDRVFDVSKPHKITPSPTSKPVIVGHHPQAADPMVNQRPSEPRHGTDGASSIRVPISVSESEPTGLGGEKPGVPLMEHHAPESKEPFVVPAVEPVPEPKPAESVPAEPALETKTAGSPPPEPAAVYPGAEKDQSAAAEVAPTATHVTAPVPVVPAPDAGPSLDDLPLPSHHGPHNGHSHAAHTPAQTKHGRDNGKLLWVIAILVLLAGVYAILDATTSSMPFHIFKKSTSSLTQ